MGFNSSLLMMRSTSGLFATQKMTERIIDLLYKRKLCHTTKQQYITNKTDFHQIDGTWSAEILDINDYNPEKNRGYRFVLVLIDKFTKIG